MTSTTELTLLRALKVWWGFTWRTWVLMLPLGILMMLLSFFFHFFPRPGESAQDFQAAHGPGYAVTFLVLWFAMLIGMFVLQTLAMRWTLLTKWSDFKLAIVPSDK